MLRLWNAKQKSILGIDISSASIKLLELGFKAGKIIVRNYAEEDFAENVVEANEIKDSEALSALLKRMLRTKGITSKEAVLAVPDSAAFSKIIQISDGLTEQELEELVVLEADKHIPYPIDEINFDFEIND